MTVKTGIYAEIRRRLAQAWPGTDLASEPTPLTGGFWASMYRLRLAGQPDGVPADVVFRVAPDDAMGAKELAVQRTVADAGFPTPEVRLAGSYDEDLGGVWSVMDFAAGAPALGDLSGVSALRRAPRLLGRLPTQLASATARLHALDADRVSAAVATAAPSVAWDVEDLAEHFVTAAEVLGRPDVANAVRCLADRRPHEGATVICHGDMHPFNLLVDDDGDLTVLDWTGAVRAEPAYDIAYTSMLLANPPLDAPRPLEVVVCAVGRRLANRFVARYAALAPDHDLSPLDWYRALHGVRLLLEATSRPTVAPNEAGAHPFGRLVPAAIEAVRAATGITVDGPA